MTEEGKAGAASLAAAKQKSLDTLFDYTKFHIGLYLTLTASYLTAKSANIGGEPVLSLNPWLAWPAVAAFMLAGLAGGVIASSITQRVGGSSIEFLADPIGPWDWKPLSMITATVAIFGWTLPHLGMVIALPILVVISALAGDEFHWKDALINSVILTIGSWVIFIYGLKLTIPLWPTFIAG